MQLYSLATLLSEDIQPRSLLPNPLVVFVLLIPTGKLHTEECGVLLPIFLEETRPTASWPWTATLTPPTFRNHVGRCSADELIWDVNPGRVLKSTLFSLRCDFNYDTS